MATLYRNLAHDINYTIQTVQKTNKKTQQHNVTDTISNKKKQQHRGKVKKKS